ncbi:hypothetical protein UFOVP726_63 [uncultured Caudovirales phage]|uniref:Uncharacterized protein n=1 Tax=uncultured Caudovirales phage TaxID=2100421 RepID=A0A6J5NLQ9_9CAUD|nr:hypothetical protein UFOVP726_63 [uncultured Caudovirales phage]
MPAISSIEANVAADFSAPLTTLTSSDTITFSPNRVQLLVIRNPTGGSLTLKIDGDAGTTVAVPGLGNVSVAGGYDIVVGAGLSRAIVLSKISSYCQGVVTLTGAASCVVQLFNI